MLPLLRKVPGLEPLAARLPLASLPTPVEKLPVEGIPGGLRVKRDDRTAEAYGGNKVRKLEFLLGEARRRQAGRLITAGALGSHHALATAVHGRREGFPVTLVLSPQPLTDHVRTVLRTHHALGAELRLVRQPELIPLELLRASLRHTGERAFVIPPGGSSPLGALGYVNGALELLDQVESGILPLPGTVHVACGTMGTTAGLALGFALGGARVRINAVRVVGRVVTNEAGIGRLVRATGRLLEAAGVKAPPVDEALALVALRHDQIGAGYGVATEAGRRATDRFREAGLHVDPTYTAKAAAGLLSAVKANAEDPHLYWHTLSHRLPEAGPLPSRGELPAEFRGFLEPA